ncbi:MAG: helix-turn-helix domain-containing protein [Henriciella sp.]|nr:helix-turn-helix domain-containing protein [Henriciella sp.]
MDEAALEKRVTDYVRQRLLALRKHSNIHINDLCVLLGVKNKQYYKYEDGTSKVPFYRLLILANHFGVSLDQFIPPLDQGDATTRGVAEAGPCFALHPKDISPLTMSDDLTAAFLSIPAPLVRQSLLDLARSIADSKGS